MSLTRINKTDEPQVIQASDGRLTISVPIQIKRRDVRGRGGMDRLPEAFAERLKTTPRLGCEVVRIEQDAKTASAIYRDRKTRAYSKESADAVVCTVPLGILSQIGTVPELSAGKRRALRQITYDSGTKVLALTRRRFWELHDGIYGGRTYTDLPIGMSYYPSDNAAGHDRDISRVDAVFYWLPIPGANPPAGLRRYPQHNVRIL